MQKNYQNFFLMQLLQVLKYHPFHLLCLTSTHFEGTKSKRDNLFKIDLSNIDVLIFYLSPHHMEQLSKKLKNNTKENVIIYSQGFPILELEASEIIGIPYALEKKLYRYDL